jgi:hypothetical protein
MPHSKNFLLNRMDAGTLDRISPDLSAIHIAQGEVLAETHGRVQKVYFPHTGIISCVVETIGGGAIETGMIGNDGVFGSSQALDDKVSLNHVVMQVPGDAPREVRAILSCPSPTDRSVQRITRRPSPHLQMAPSDARAGR